jgi:hypothetical protein
LCALDLCRAAAAENRDAALAIARWAEFEKLAITTAAIGGDDFVAGRLTERAIGP